MSHNPWLFEPNEQWSKYHLLTL